MMRRFYDVILANRCLWVGCSFVLLWKPDPTAPGGGRNVAWCPGCGTVKEPK